MEIFGRLTADSRVNELKDGRKVVNFSVALNESYRTKDSDDIKKVTTYFNCSYWLGDNIAKVLTKGTMVELYGRVGVNTYTNQKGETKASLNFHVNHIKLHGKPNTGKATQPVTVLTDADQNGDDLPF
jgi:single-strand DNA-binding protein